MPRVPSYLPTSREATFTKRSSGEKVASSPQRAALSLEQMPDLVLLKIVSLLPTLEKYWPCESEIKKAIKTFNALSKVNRRFHEFFTENYTRGLFVKALLERSTLVRSIREGTFNHCLNLDLGALELGFRLYLEDQSNAFFKVRALEQKISKLVTIFIDKAKVELKSDLSFSHVEQVRIEHPVSLGDFMIHVYYTDIYIFTPSRFIELRGILPIEGTSEELLPQISSLTISDFLIKHLDATLEEASNIRSAAWEFSKADPRDTQIRRIAHQELKQLTRQDLRKALGSQRVIAPFKSQGPIRYKIGSIGFWGNHVLETATFSLKNNGLIPPWEMLHRICFIINFFWGSRTHHNVIISLLERGNVKSLEEIHAFLVEGVIRLYEKEGKSKEGIVEEVNLPFVNQEHPILILFLKGYTNALIERELLSSNGLIFKYKSGMSNQELFEDYAKKRGILGRSDPRTYKWIGKYFWGDEGEVIVRKSVKKLLGIDPESYTYEREERLFWDCLALHFLEKRESREEILKELGLPSPLEIYDLVKNWAFWVFFGKSFEDLFIEENFQVLFSMIEKSISAFFSSRSIRLTHSHFLR